MDEDARNPATDLDQESDRILADIHATIEALERNTAELNRHVPLRRVYAFCAQCHGCDWFKVTRTWAKAQAAAKAHAHFCQDMTDATWVEQATNAQGTVFFFNPFPRKAA